MTERCGGCRIRWLLPQHRRLPVNRPVKGEVNARMTSRLIDVMSGKTDNYILPFLWVRGEEEAVIREEMARIYAAGIRAVCVEARPHPDYLGPKWWRDMDIIMEEARKRGMRVWVLDDDHFPTGHAAGRLKNAPKELRRLFIYETHIDAIGPQDHSSFFVAPMPHHPRLGGGGTLMAVVAVKRDPATGELTEETADLTSRVKNGFLHWDVPEGHWRIFSLIETEHGGDPSKSDYINYIDANSVRVLIDTVYEAFYCRYKENFGKTFAGFFSDEPGFYNDKETFDFESRLGKPDVTLPWSREMPAVLEKSFGPEYKQFLPFLWHQGGPMMRKMRYAYMDAVSLLFAKNFTAQIGDWCRARGVEYIGHILEDNNVHARLGCGAGHFFRALEGQDMSGLDVVLWQLKPGFDDVPYRGFLHEYDAEFFFYGLAKMAVSLAHADPKKKGRTVAEVFGAFGWAEGLKLMKWMTDHMLVRGVTHFVPHAFSLREFPDWDCPPHMYARGRNPQYRYYKYLNAYTNRLSHLLSGGIHVATAAVLYHAEAEWSGTCMHFHKPVKTLMKAQIDCDVLSCDMLLDRVSVQNGKLVQQNESYDCLIIPYCEALPGRVLLRILELAEQGVPVFFINGLPQATSDGQADADVLHCLSACGRIEVVQLDGLVPRLKEAGFYDIRVEGQEPHLRFYHAKYPDMDVFLFFNEHPLREIDTEAELPVAGRALLYDAYDNKLYEADGVQDGRVVRVKLNLSPMEAMVVIAGPALDGLPAEKRVASGCLYTAIDGPWLVETATAVQYPAFTPRKEIAALTDLSRDDEFASFSGTYRYTTKFHWSPEAGQLAVLDIGRAFETAEVFVNGLSAGVRISAPYRFDISGLVREGKNTLAIEVTTTLFNEVKDFMSRPAQLEPGGLLGPVKLYVLG